MSKQGFIDGLRAYLSGRVSPRLVEEHANYYEDYINMQIRMGKSEAEVLEGLGDPRWIAKTIINANGGDDTTGSAGSYGTTSGAGYGSGNESGSWNGGSGAGSYGTGGYSSGGYSGYGDREYVTPTEGGLVARIKAWFEKWSPKIVKTALVLLVLSGVVSLFFSIVGVLIPFAIPILFMVFIIKLFKDWLN